MYTQTLIRRGSSGRGRRGGCRAHLTASVARSNSRLLFHALHQNPFAARLAIQLDHFGIICFGFRLSSFLGIGWNENLLFAPWAYHMWLICDCVICLFHSSRHLPFDMPQRIHQVRSWNKDRLIANSTENLLLGLFLSAFGIGTCWQILFVAGGTSLTHPSTFGNEQEAITNGAMKLFWGTLEFDDRFLCRGSRLRDRSLGVICGLFQMTCSRSVGDWSNSVAFLTCHSLGLLHRWSVLFTPTLCTFFFRPVVSMILRTSPLEQLFRNRNLTRASRTLNTAGRSFQIVVSFFRVIRCRFCSRFGRFSDFVKEAHVVERKKWRCVSIV